MKRTRHLFSVVLGGLVLALAGCATQHSSDMSRLQGTWKGQEVHPPRPGNCYLVISGNHLEFRGADTNEWYQGSFYLREDTRPKQLVGTIADCPAQEYVGKTVHAIYSLENGTLTIAGNEPGTPEPPASFDAPGAREFVLKPE